MSDKEKAMVSKEEEAALALFEADGESGFEGTSNDTFKTPYIKILQGQSPECDEDDPKYVKGAKKGMFYNTATGTLSDELVGIVLKIEHTLMVWKPNRGGLVGVYPKSEETSIVAERNGVKKWDADGNIVNDTLSFYMMNPEDPTDIYIISADSASFKHGQNFASRIRALKLNNKPVMKAWAGIWSVKLVVEENDKGKWYTIGNSPEFVKFVTPDLINNAIKPALEILKTAETDHSQMVDGAGQKDANIHEEENF